MTHTIHRRRIEKRPRLLKRLLTAAWILAVCALLAYVPAATMAYISDRRTDSDRYAAILISAHAIAGNDHWLPPIALLGSYPAWTLYFHARGLKPVYSLSATYRAFVSVTAKARRMCSAKSLRSCSAIIGMRFTSL